MKYFILILCCCYCIAARAQDTLNLKRPSYLNLYSIPNPDIIDTSSIVKLNNKFYIAESRQDRMPVLLPSGTGKKMLNAGGGMHKTDRMPNLWDKPGGDGNKRIQPLYIRPLYYYSTPSLLARSGYHFKRKNTKPSYRWEQY
ncbi:hypothetical protein [Niabella hirudinis]|uniref:hypothetical protein n=1 Tax=Niabella hirudinis TaxID=1285929 RepID=UPI003EB6F5D0